MTDIQAAIAPLLGTQVVVRARDASPFFGTLEAVDGRIVALRDARRIRAWFTAGKETTLSGLARHGVVHGHNATHVCGPVDHVVIQDACEILSMTSEAIESLRTCPAAEQS